MIFPQNHFSSENWNLQLMNFYKNFFLFILVIGISLSIIPNFSWELMVFMKYSVGVWCWNSQKIFFLFSSAITGTIIIFSYYYMHAEEYYYFFLFLSYFLFFMLILVVGKGLFSIFFGWEGVGIMSFLLIGWFSARESAIFASKKAIFYNRVGDFFFIFLIGNELFYQIILNNVGFFTIYSLGTPLSVLFFFSCLLCILGKSAQFPFNPWLTSAMEGPTPVSALLHSSTMVVAGVYFFFIMFHLIHMSKVLILMLMILSSFTMALSSLAAMYHFDMKKIIALSTASQLGFMIFTLSMGMKDVAFFHLLSHGFFKALLFLTSGVMIHQKSDSQDIQKSNFSINFDFFLKNIFYYSNMALMGLPFIGAFFSKHKILSSLSEQSFPSFFIILGGLSLCFTVAYSLRLINMIYHKKSIHQTECFSMGYNWFILGTSLLSLMLLVFFFSWSMQNFYFSIVDFFPKNQSNFFYFILGWGILGYFIFKIFNKSQFSFNYFFISLFNRHIFYNVFKINSGKLNMFLENNTLPFLFKKKFFLLPVFLQTPEKISFLSSFLNFPFFMVGLMALCFLL